MSCVKYVRMMIVAYYLRQELLKVESNLTLHSPDCRPNKADQFKHEQNLLLLFAVCSKTVAAKVQETTTGTDMNL